MRKWIVVLVLSLLSTSASARDVNEQMGADATGNVEINNTAGSVTVEGWSRNEVEVVGTLGNEVEDFVFERDGDEILIKVEAKKGRSGGRGYTSELSIKVPKDSSIDVVTVSAEIEIKGVYGELEAKTVSGNIDLEAFEAQIEAQSVSGDIEVQGDGKESRAELVSVSGDVSAEKLAGEAELESVSGDAALVGGPFDEVAMETVNGDIVFEGSLVRGGDVAMETVNGSINVDFIGDVSAEFEIETFNGRIRNCFGPKPERVSKYAPGYELSFTEGGGEGRVAIATLNGSLNICKK